MAVRRRVETAVIVERLGPTRRMALIEALSAFDEAGGEPSAPDPHPLGWAMNDAVPPGM
ncbi:hypothetical protein ACIBAI_07840 [Streptomyces sp. NPDC051041]|uniref:hypothetical protein n=1 Tax=Streptomyces sp. NPDC051041 TaxID=3365640 RepID=UPI0037B61F72